MSDINTDAITKETIEYTQKPMSRNKTKLFIELVNMENTNSNDVSSVSKIFKYNIFLYFLNIQPEIIKKRNCMVRYYHARLEKRRRKLALHRLLRANNRDEAPEIDCMVLQFEETDQKQLNRSNYYDENEPEIFVIIHQPF